MECQFSTENVDDYLPEEIGKDCQGKVIVFPTAISQETRSFLQPTSIFKQLVDKRIAVVKKFSHLRLNRRYRRLAQIVGQRGLSSNRRCGFGTHIAATNQ